MKRKAIIAAALSLALCAGMNITASAQNPLAYMEAQSRKAVETAVREGTVPPGTTIYDCMYGADSSGATVVVKYKDGGVWVDVSGQKADAGKSAGTADSSDGADAAPAPEETLAEYADELFRLTNAEREKEGLAPLERDSLLDEAAMIRTPEIIEVDRAGGKAHTRPDGGSYTDVIDELGGDGKRCGENIARSEGSPQAAMEAWMRSEGHCKNILYEHYGSMGIGVCRLPEGSLDWVVIFMLK